MKPRIIGFELSGIRKDPLLTALNADTEKSALRPNFECGLHPVIVIMLGSTNKSDSLLEYLELFSYSKSGF